MFEIQLERVYLGNKRNITFVRNYAISDSKQAEKFTLLYVT